MALLVTLTLVLLIIGRHTPWLDPVRSKLDLFAVPFYWITDMPNRVSAWFDSTLLSRQRLLEENALLKNQLRVQESRLQKMASLVADNVQLQQLMNASDDVQDRVLIAGLIGVSPNRAQHKIIINKGDRDGVYVGQPLLDASGLMGQVVSVTPYTSQVLLITDNAHAIPIQVHRSGVRSVAEGIGDLYQLRLRYVSATTDIRPGDLLVSSGLGGRFPKGYPVAKVATITFDPGEPFASVVARPLAQLDRSRHVLLVFSDQSVTGLH